MIFTGAHTGERQSQDSNSGLSDSRGWLFATMLYSLLALSRLPSFTSSWCTLPRGMELSTSILKMSFQGVGSAMFVTSLVPQDEQEPGVVNSYGHMFKPPQRFLGRGGASVGV